MELSNLVESLYLVAGVFSLSLLIAFLFEDVKKINFGFFAFFLFLGLWDISFYFWLIGSNEGDFDYWLMISNFSFSFLPVVLYSLISFLLEKNRKFLLINGYFLSIIFSIISFLNLYYLGLNDHKNLLPGINLIYLFYIIFVYFGFLLLGVFDLLREVKNFVSRKEKYLIFYILFFYVAIFISGVCNFPILYGIRTVSYGGIIFSFLSLLLMVQIIVKFDILNKKAFYAQSLFGLIISINIIEIVFADSLIGQTYKGLMLIFLMIFSNILIRSYKEDIYQKEGLVRMRKKLELNNKKLRELDGAKNEFISIAAHQLRTPPTVIKGYLSLIKDNPESKNMSSDTRDALLRALASNERLIELVEDILSISRIESGKMQYDFQSDQSIEKIIREIEDNFETKAKDRHLKFKVEITSRKVPLIVMDSKRIKEVLSNLVDNAIKYTVKGSVLVRCLKRSDVIRIEVSDTGVGISKKEIPGLFNKFSRSSNADKLGVGGIGLGIYVGKKIIEAHGGKIWAESEGVDKGSVFIVELPIDNGLN